jgi:hypothetical protein
VICTLSDLIVRIACRMKGGLQGYSNVTLLIDAAGEEPAVNSQNLAGYE